MKRILSLVVASLMLLTVMSAVSCTNNSDASVIKELESSLSTVISEKEALQKQVDEMSEMVDELNNKLTEMEKQLNDVDVDVKDLETNTFAHQYDFYITVGTLPTLYATLNAYATRNPNTYMWFERGNTISYEYTADFIHYFSTQSKTNAASPQDQGVIREKVSEILKADPEAKFHLYCDDLRVAYILNIFVRAGVSFEDMEITFISDGTATYSDFAAQTDDLYGAFAETWATRLQEAVDGRTDTSYVYPYNDAGSGVELMGMAYYLTTFDNVELWVQHPNYLKCDSAKVNADRENMNIVGKDPKEIYDKCMKHSYDNYQKVVLANALVGSDTLDTLEDAVAYFDSQLSGRDKEVVLILGTGRPTLAENKFYFDSTIEFYTPTVLANDATKVMYKGKTYDITEGATTVVIDGRTLTIGELGVYLFFKGHPAYTMERAVLDYFTANGIVELPRRTPVEVLFWMYDVKVGGFESTSFLSTYEGQTEFMYEEPVNTALIQMKGEGFFDGATYFKANA